MIEYHLKYYHTHSGSEHNIENFSFGDLYKFLHLGYTYVRNRENHVWQILKEMPKKLPDNNGYSYEVLNSNNHIFLSSEEINKIATLGVVSYKSLDEKIFYDLQKPRLKKYFFGISEKTLNEEKDLLQKIRSYVKDKSEEKCSACFAIYSTNYEQDYVYVAQYASLIQEQNLDS